MIEQLSGYYSKVEIDPPQEDGSESTLPLPPDLDDQYIEPLEDFIERAEESAGQEMLGAQFADAVVDFLDATVEPHSVVEGEAYSFAEDLRRIAQLIGNRDQEFYIEARTLNDKAGIEQVDFLLRWLLRFMIDISPIGDPIDTFQALYSMKDIARLATKKGITNKERAFQIGDELLEGADFWVTALLPLPGMFAPKKLLVHTEILTFYLSQLAAQLSSNKADTAAMHVTLERIFNSRSGNLIRSLSI